MVQSYTNADIGELPRPAPKLPGLVMDYFSLKGKVALITGSLKGIGWAVAEAFAQAGADVAIWYNSHPADTKAKELEEKYGVRAKAYKCNITDHEEVARVVQQQEKDFGTIDVFVANAGVAWEKGACCDYEDGINEWKKVIDADFNAVYFCARAVQPIFKKKGKGSFVITALMLGHIVNVPQLQAPYNAAKAACLMFARSLAVEWAPFARVNLVLPGYIGTELLKFADEDTKNKWYQLTPLGREALPQELVGAYLYFASDASTYTTGSDLLVDGGYACP